VLRGGVGVVHLRHPGSRQRPTAYGSVGAHPRRHEE
jgi:hypothetical protein